MGFCKKMSLKKRVPYRNEGIRSFKKFSIFCKKNSKALYKSII